MIIMTKNSSNIWKLTQPKSSVKPSFLIYIIFIYLNKYSSICFKFNVILNRYTYDKFLIKTVLDSKSI